MKRNLKTALLLASAVATLSFSSFGLIVSEGITQLGGDISRLIAQSGTNFVISPFSISQALTSVYAGAKGDTAAAMKEGLYLGDNTDVFHAEYGGLSTHLMSKNKSEKQTLLISNAIWLQKGSSITPEFSRRLGEFYHMKTRMVDFATQPDAAKEKINNLVNKQTNGKISNLLEKILPDTDFVITNAIYFDGTWKKSFEEELMKGDFYTSREVRVEVDYMTKTEDMQFGSDEEKTYIIMPYDGGTLAALIVVPNHMTQFENDLTSNMVNQMMQAEQREVHVTLPKFKIETSINSMKEMLSSLGNLKIMFDMESVDLSGINGIKRGQGKLVIGDVIHKAIIEVSQTGTTAAAATAVGGIHATSVRVDDSVYFTANRPFYFFIVDTETNATLFNARVMNPNA